MFEKFLIAVPLAILLTAIVAFIAWIIFDWYFISCVIIDVFYSIKNKIAKIKYSFTQHRT